MFLPQNSPPPLMPIAKRIEAAWERMKTAATMPRIAPGKAAGEFSEGGRVLGYDRWKTTNPADETLGSAAQISDAVLAEVLNWDDALGLAYQLSPHYANYTEVERLAIAIWWRAQERHQLDKDERS
jgi:hypothetical protein